MTVKNSQHPEQSQSAQLTWPDQPSGILIMGKRQGTKKENKQLWGRAALAAALWYSAPHPKPYLLFVAADVHGPQHTPDAEAVKRLLMQKFHIPGDYIITRQKSNCTLLEVRMAQAIARAQNLATIFAVTHLYHAPRSQKYFDEVMANASVIPAHPDILNEITFPLENLDLLEEIKKMVRASMPHQPDLSREYAVEWLLTLAHKIDPKGRLERRLAKLLRPATYRHQPAPPPNSDSAEP
ncbi:MAG: hypothetical protein Kow0031_22110 [Anaerolineae bacterium]